VQITRSKEIKLVMKAKRMLFIYN